jgi:hypothetical protein
MPWWLPWFSGAAGTMIMLVALGVIAVPAESIRAPRAVLFTAGAMFVLVAVILKLIPTRQAHPARYMFFCAVLCTAFLAIATWAALFATDIKGSVGPARFTSPATDIAGRVAFGFGALLLAGLSGMAWHKWWRALRGRPISLD